LLNPSTAIMDAPGTNKDVVLSAKKAPAQDSARAAEIFARIYEIQRLEKQVENLTEKIMHLEEGSIWQQETRSAASPENRNRNRRWISYEMGRTDRDTEGPKLAIEDRTRSLGSDEQLITTGKQWQISVEAVGKVVELDRRIGGCSSRISDEQAHIEHYRTETEHLYREQREVTIETGGV
jgi:hypothetical protein